MATKCISALCKSQVETKRLFYSNATTPTSPRMSYNVDRPKNWMFLEHARRPYKVLWMGSNTVVADALVLSYTNTNSDDITSSAARLQEILAPLLNVKRVDEVKAFAGPYVLTPSPLQWVRYYRSCGDYPDKWYESVVATIRRGWQFLLDNKDTPIVVTRYANSDIRDACKDDRNCWFALCRHAARGI